VRVNFRCSLAATLQLLMIDLAASSTVESEWSSELCGKSGNLLHRIKHLKYPVTEQYYQVYEGNSMVA
jgi:hypothetical protein